MRFRRLIELSTTLDVVSNNTDLCQKNPVQVIGGQIGRMQFERTTRKITASREDWKLLRRIVRLRTKTDVPPLGLWRAVDDEFLWARHKPSGGTSVFVLSLTIRRSSFQSSLDEIGRAHV